MRSMLVVPVDDAAALDRAFAAGADAIVLDLWAEASAVTREAARHNARDVLRSAQIDSHRPHIFVRLGDLDETGFDADLAAIMIGEPDGILLAGSRSGMDIQQLGAKLAVQEAEYGLADGETGIIAEGGTTARALFGLGSYADASARLIGMTWHAERLASDLGSDHLPEELGEFELLHTARHLILFAARAVGVSAIDTPAVARDAKAFETACTSARRLGFNAKLTTRPEQVDVINAVFNRE
jgi:citrate lyase subunit beta / citryl-CoA lyase